MSLRTALFGKRQNDEKARRKSDTRSSGGGESSPAAAKRQIVPVAGSGKPGTPSGGARKQPGSPEQLSARRERAARPHSHYQDWDGDGSSKSHEKLKALKLGRIAPGDNPLQGLSVLDIGCNEGFFCNVAVQQGASRVVGMDKNKAVIESAKLRTPEATFIAGSWWDIPEGETFDVILFLSAIHYEPDQKGLLRKLWRHLTPTGTLVLECGIGSGSGRSWHLDKRKSGLLRYPSRDLLMNDLLSDFASRLHGRSVDQKGDRMPRYVFHCHRRQPTALIIGAKSLRGKTVLGRSLAAGGIPVYSTDDFLGRLIRVDGPFAWSDAHKRLLDRTAARDHSQFNVVAKDIVDLKLEDEVASFIALELPGEVDLFAMEGDLLRHPSIAACLHKRIAERGIRMWDVRPSAPID